MASDLCCCTSNYGGFDVDNWCVYYADIVIDSNAVEA